MLYQPITKFEDLIVYQQSFQFALDLKQFLDTIKRQDKHLRLKDETLHHAMNIGAKIAYCFQPEHIDMMLEDLPIPRHYAQETKKDLRVLEAHHIVIRRQTQKYIDQLDNIIDKLHGLFKYLLEYRDEEKYHYRFFGDQYGIDPDEGDNRIGINL